MKNNSLPIIKLLETIRILRGTNGCPWDKKQTGTSLKKYLKEEVEELLIALDNNDPENICEEIGDVLYILIMLAEIHNDKQQFNFDKAIIDINSKLIRRHPHVFEGKPYENEDELRQQWQRIKNMEKKRND